MSRMLTLAVLYAATSAAHGASMADPTRPPGATAGDEGQSALSAPGAKLESVLIAPDRRIAIIGGQAFRVGEKYGEGRIVRITETEVVIRGPEASETLKLYPEVQKTPRRARERRSEK